MLPCIVLYKTNSFVNSFTSPFIFSSCGAHSVQFLRSNLRKMRPLLLQSATFLASTLTFVPLTAAETRFGSFFNILNLSPFQFFQGTFATIPQLPAPPALPSRFGYLLFPGFQALDVFGPVDALNLLSWSHNNTFSFLSRTLDPVSTQVWDSDFNKFNSTFAQSVIPTHTLDDPPPLDVLVIPGGIGTRAPLDAEVEYIKRTYPSLQYLISVCTGASLIGRAGVLNGRKGTTNKRVYCATISCCPKVHWVSHARWVQDGNIWTSSGVSAGIDAIFGWISHVYGEPVAKGIANGMEYTRHLNASYDPFSELDNVNCTTKTAGVAPSSNIPGDEL